MDFDYCDSPKLHIHRETRWFRPQWINHPRYHRLRTGLGKTGTTKHKRLKNCAMQQAKRSEKSKPNVLKKWRCPKSWGYPKMVCNGKTLSKYGWSAGTLILGHPQIQTTSSGLMIRDDEGLRMGWSLGGQGTNVMICNHPGDSQLGRFLPKAEILLCATVQSDLWVYENSIQH